MRWFSGFFALPYIKRRDYTYNINVKNHNPQSIIPANPLGPAKNPAKITKTQTSEKTIIMKQRKNINKKHKKRKNVFTC